MTTTPDEQKIEKWQQSADETIERLKGLMLIQKLSRILNAMLETPTDAPTVKGILLGLAASIEVNDPEGFGEVMQFWKEKTLEIIKIHLSGDHDENT